MSASTLTSTLFVVTIASDGTPIHALTFASFIDATAYMVEAQQAGFTTALSSVTGNVQIDQPKAAAPAKVEAKPAPKGRKARKAQPKVAATPAKSDKSEDDRKYEVTVTVKETGKLIAKKVIVGEAKALKYKATCEGNKLPKHVEITQL